MTLSCRRLVNVSMPDRLTHHVRILKLNGESYRLKQSKARRRRAAQTADDEAVAVDPETGEITP
jgi:acyl-CoA thioesterase FadM